MGKNVHKIGKELFITNDEEIKEGDWFIRDDSIHKCFRVHKTDIEFLTPIDSVYCGSNTFWNKEFCKKIILTTDQDLIADGVQAIDDEFSEWFVKNPTCEEVKIVDGYQIFSNKNAVKIYKIIIPKEESKQECMITKNSYPSSEFESKDRCPSCGNFCNIHTDLNDNDECNDCRDNIDTLEIGQIIPKEEPKQETLEEIVAKKLYPYNDGFQVMDIDISEELQLAFINGAKWQQERSYSEEDMKSAFKIGFSIGYGSPVNGLGSKDETCDVWFEQFKKK